MVPIRVIAETLGGNVTWIEETRTAIIVGDRGEFSLQIDEPLPANMGNIIIRDDRTFVPMRHAAEMLGASVRWDNDNRAAYIYQ